MVDGTAEVPAGTPVEKMGIVARLFGIFYSPGRVFEHVKSRPVWFVVLIVVALVIAAFQFGFLNTEKGVQIAKDQILEGARDSGQDISEESLDTFVTIQKYAGPAAILILVPLFSVALAGLVYLIFNIMLGGEATFRQVLSCYAHTTPITIPQQGLTLLMVYMKGEASPVTSLAAFLPFLERDTLWYRISAGIDVFTIWQVGILSLGLSLLYGFRPKKCATVLYGTYLGLVVVISLIIGLFD